MNLCFINIFRIIKIDSAIHVSKESSTAKTVGATSQSKTGQKSAPLEFSQTPKKYRRRPLTQDEIDLVTVNQSFYCFILFNYFICLDWWIYLITIPYINTLQLEQKIPI